MQGLEEWLEDEFEQSKPEYLRKRPKYYYYYEWMRGRIGKECPGLPEPVMDKLLTLDSSELDLLLQHESALRGQAQEFLEVFNRDGAEALETYGTTALTWEEVKALKGPGTVGLGFGAEAAPGAGFLEGERDTDHALVGGRGEAGMLTDAERRVPAPGEPLAVPVLPPDQARDQLRIMDGFAADQERLVGMLLPEGGFPGGRALDAETAEYKEELDASERQRRVLAAADGAIQAADPGLHRPYGAGGADRAMDGSYDAMD